MKWHGKSVYNNVHCTYNNYTHAKHVQTYITIKRKLEYYVNVEMMKMHKLLNKT
jgi:hypothetical protein